MRNWLESFLSRIEVRGPDDCWPWRGARLKAGYGHVTLNQKVSTTAHRTLWEIKNKREVPPKMVICHSCDHPWCMNDRHFFLGTEKDNQQDKMRKGRGKYRRPQKNILNWKKAERIRAIISKLPVGHRFKGSFRHPVYRRLAKHYKTSICTIQKAAWGVTWVRPKPLAS